MKKEGIFRCKNKVGQITIFVILALVIVGSIAGYFVFKKFSAPEIPDEAKPVYDYYISCLEQTSRDGASLLGTQGGYIELPEFEPGSEYAPFSSQLAFMGFGIPYWHYVSGNGVEKEQVPSVQQMQTHLAKYLEEEITRKCNFTNFVEKGYRIILEEPQQNSAKVLITNNKISVSLNENLNVIYDNSSFSFSSHSIEFDSKLGEFYNAARKVFDHEKTSLFLENYSIDVLYNYAPVEGVVFNCSPAVWSPYEVADTLKAGLSANIQSLKMQGDYYISKNPHSNYFIAGKESGINFKNSQISFLYSPTWPSRIEIWPTKNNAMIAEPIGLQAGLGVLGFCYTPYKFVYDVYFPVLVQIYNPSDASEIFQFPLAIVINKNVPRESLSAQAPEVQENMCDGRKQTSEITISTYNVNLEPVEAEISLKCLNDECFLGKTEVERIGNRSVGTISSLNTKAPPCVNALMTAKSAGYKDKQQIVSTNQEGSIDLILDRLYKLKLEIYVDGMPVSKKDMAVFSLTENIEGAPVNSNSIAYPFNQEIEIAEGDYSFDLKVYKAESINIPSTSTRTCIEVPRSNVLGLFGLTEEKCTDVNIPSQTLSNALSAGGKLNQYVTPTEIENAKVMRIYAASIKAPKTLEEYSTAYDEVELKKIMIEFA